jgi:hypothetical protein
MGVGHGTKVVQACGHLARTGVLRTIKPGQPPAGCSTLKWPRCSPAHPPPVDALVRGRAEPLEHRLGIGGIERRARTVRNLQLRAIPSRLTRPACQVHGNLSQWVMVDCAIPGDIHAERRFSADGSRRRSWFIRRADRPDLLGHKCRPLSVAEEVDLCPPTGNIRVYCGARTQLGLGGSLPRTGLVPSSTRP